MQATQHSMKCAFIKFLLIQFDKIQHLMLYTGIFSLHYNSYKDLNRMDYLVTHTVTIEKGKSLETMRRKAMT